MTNHSWSNKRIQGAVLTQDLITSIPKASQNFITIRKNNLRQTITYPRGLFYVGKAYAEPQSGIDIENLLLQRDFIID